MEERGCFYDYIEGKIKEDGVVDFTQQTQYPTKKEPDIRDKYRANLHDPVEKPAHYNQGGVECIDYIRQVLGDEGFKAYCLGNTIKYLHRHDYKGKPKEDLRKAQYYLNAAISTLDDK